MQHEQCSPQRSAGRENFGILRRCQQTAGTRKLPALPVLCDCFSRERDCAQSGSNAQTMTTLGATGTDHRTAATGAHTNEEAVGTLATHDGRLIGTLHGFVPCKKSPILQPVTGQPVKHYLIRRPY
jgi:hypothetical protein